MSVKAILYGQSYTKAEMDILLGNVQNTLQFEDEPSQNSTKLLTSGSIFTALGSKANSSDLSGYATTANLTSGLNTKVNKSDVASSVQQGNYNPVSSDGVYTAIQGLTPGGSLIVVDDTLSDSSTNPVQNKKIYEALETKADSSDLANYATTSDLTTSLASKAPTDHASTAITYGKATNSKYGHVKLSDATDSTTAAQSGGTAATPYALSAAVTGIYNAANPSVTWTGGTSAGPTLKITVLNKNSTAVAIPSASATASGIVTTGTQTFSGDKTVSGDLVIYKQSSTEDDLPAALYFQPAQTDGPQNENYCFIKAYDDGDSNGAGTNLIMRSGGNLIIGGGESPSYFYTNVIKSNSRTTENTYVIADGVTFLYSNAGASGNDVSNRVGLAITTSGHIIPRHADPETNADADNNDVQNLGTSSNRWHTVYASTFNGTSFTGNAATATTATKLSNTAKIGDTNKPVYFNADGTPTAISYTIGTSVPQNAVFTDTKVTQTSKTDDVAYKLLFTSSASPTSGSAATAAYNGSITVNPSTSTITATNFSGNATTATSLKTGRTLKVNLASTSASTAFNGTAAISDIGVSGVLDAANGGTGQNTLKKSANALINALNTGTNVTVGNDYLIAQYSGGGDSNTDFYRKAASNVRVGGLTTARSLKVALGSTSAASFDGTADATSIGVSGTLPVNRGGTGKTNTYLNGVIVGGATPSTEGGSSSTEAWQSIRTGSGAFFATARDAKPSFGTLPVAQGGTGVTSLADLKTALGVDSGISSALINNLTSTSTINIVNTGNTYPWSCWLMYRSSSDVSGSLFVIKTASTSGELLTGSNAPSSPGFQFATAKTIKITNYSALSASDTYKLYIWSDKAFTTSVS